MPAELGDAIEHRPTDHLPHEMRIVVGLGEERVQHAIPLAKSPLLWIVDMQNRQPRPKRIHNSRSRGNCGVARVGEACSKDKMPCAVTHGETPSSKKL